MPVPLYRGRACLRAYCKFNIHKNVDVCRFDLNCMPLFDIYVCFLDLNKALFVENTGYLLFDLPPELTKYL